MKFIWRYLRKRKKFIFLNLLSAFGFVLIEVGIPTLLATGINNKFNGYDTNYILKLAMLMTVFAIVGLGLLLLLAYSTNRLAVDIVEELRNDIFKKVQTFSNKDYEKFGVSRLVTNNGSDGWIIMQFMAAVLRAGIIAPILILTSFTLIFMQSKALAFITLCAIPLMLLAIYFINKKSKPLSRKQKKGLDKINLSMRENITGLRVIRGFNNEKFQENRFRKVNESYSKVSKKMYQTVAFISPAFSIVFSLVMVAVLQISTSQINQGLMELGTLAAFVEYVFHALFSFLILASILIMYPQTMVSVERVKEVLDAVPSIDKNENGVVETETMGEIEFKNVCFSYDTDTCEKAVIKDVSFAASPGQTVALVGSTGSGKSTVIRLIPRLYDITSGEILIDGVNVKDYNLNALRDKISYIPQKALLFSGTIKENLSFGNQGASMDKLEYAADIAQAKDFISSRGKGYDSVLAEGGINLSGGQKQRLCIARGLTRDVPIYIFDDSFSALDFKTDAMLRSRLKEVTQDSTVLIVAQRVSTVLDADKIIVLDEGKIVGMGTHKELLESSQIYYEIASSQLTKEELAI